MGYPAPWHKNMFTIIHRQKRFLEKGNHLDENPNLSFIIR